MPLSPLDRVRFVNSYTRTLVNAWSNESFADELDTDPRAALTRMGIELPDDAVVDLVRAEPDGRAEGNVDIQIELYEQGLESGRFEFRVPVVPRVETVELSDDDLEAVYAGAVNCSCCPCCCCT